MTPEQEYEVLRAAICRAAYEASSRAELDRMLEEMRRRWPDGWKVMEGMRQCC